MPPCLCLAIVEYLCSCSPPSILLSNLYFKASRYRKWGKHAVFVLFHITQWSPASSIFLKNKFNSSLSLLLRPKSHNPQLTLNSLCVGRCPWVLNLPASPSPVLDLQGMPTHFVSFIFHGWIKLYCVYVARFLYLSICWWASRSAPYLVSLEQCSSKHGCVSLSVVCWLSILQAHSQEPHIWVTW